MYGMKSILMLLFSGALLGFSTPTTTDTSAPLDQHGAAAEMIWDQLLQAHVDRSGNVNYSAMKADARFKTCTAAFSKIKMGADWSDGRKMAYWINAYNVFTVKLICDNYPLESITDLKEPWKQKFIELDGKTYSLNQIENEILRPTFKDPRIHFAVNCASYSCPKLNNRAFFEASLDKVMDTLTRQFVTDAKRNTLAADKAEISKIFEWYAEDFTKNGKSVIGFLNGYGAGLQPGATITYKDYDWSLNSK